MYCDAAGKDGVPDLRMFSANGGSWSLTGFNTGNFDVSFYGIQGSTALKRHYIAGLFGTELGSGDSRVGPGWGVQGAMCNSASYVFSISDVSVGVGGSAGISGFDFRIWWMDNPTDKSTLITTP